MCGSGHDEGVAVPGVEPLREVAGELQVLPLVLADGHPGGVVEQDVGRLQDRVGEQADRGAVDALAGRLVLELRHASGLAEPGQALQHPRELGVLGDMALDEEDRAGRVDAGGEELGGGQPRPAAEQPGVVLDGDRVLVDDAVVGAVVLLQGHPLHERPQVVPEVQRVRGRLHARQQARRLRRRHCRAGRFGGRHGRHSGTSPACDQTRTHPRVPVVCTCSALRTGQTPVAASRTPPRADGSGMGTTVGAGSEHAPANRRSLWWGRLRRLASAVIAMIAVVLAGSDAVGASTPPGQDVSWPQCSSRQGGYGLPMPSASAPFVVVGLTAGRAFTRIRA
jgi:hypothetical protein